MIPAMKERLLVLFKQLSIPTQTRKDNIPDDFIRGQIAAFNWIVEWPEKRAKFLQEQFKEEIDLLVGEERNGAATAP
jgi:hypothetical protein